MHAAAAFEHYSEATPPNPSAEPRVGTVGDVLALPEPQAAPAAGSSNSGAQTLTVGGGKVSLDELGPAIVAEDGTLRRIANWAQLTERERQVALRRIGARNQERIAALKQQQEQQEQHGASGQPSEEQAHKAQQDQKAAHQPEQEL
ncbi:hypothetical protein CHLRE_06g303183v5 [Chlamydomonas reinhardtii]|uniref:Uncharacterized protein n=1 Tax=Chlamydomonas reinhardtii TaxID=3055 RepID=A0A2K3DR40_CHLRE|nr:uncharacterized protein CHLRE_06g303183v5 [Chlamydomonas reinhardtii]PNW83015.1 hypothetical protein CHLRE_06g303183v5 [Chlamydomonas reinhardtii]